MYKQLLLLAIAMMMVFTGCKRVSVHVKSDDENVHLVLPFFVVKQALHFSSESVLEIDDLGGVDQEIDLRAVARALHQDGDSIRIAISQDGQQIDGRRVGDAFRIHVTEDDETVTLNLPMSLMRKLGAMEDHQSLDSADIVAALSGFSGELLHVKGPDETVSISIR